MLSFYAYAFGSYGATLFIDMDSDLSVYINTSIVPEPMIMTS